jgi:sugar phosphate isomerase/epimerase
MRRLWVVATALLAVGITTSTRAQAPADAPLKLNYAAMRKLGWRLSCQAWTFREMSAFETIDTIHRLGIRYIEFFPGQRFSKEKPDAKLDHNMSAELMDQLKAKLKDANVTAMNYGVVGLGTEEAGARKVFEWAKGIGIRTIVSEPAEEAVPMLDRLCQEYGINLAIHDHPKPSHYWNPDTVLKVSEGRSRRVGACADTGHWYRSGLVPVECLKKLEGRIISMHFKDLDETRKDVPWGTGLCNARGMLEEVKRQGVKPVISIEYEHGSGAALLANVTKCVEWFDKTATELAQ